MHREISIGSTVSLPRIGEFHAPICLRGCFEFFPVHCSKLLIVFFIRRQNKFLQYGQRKAASLVPPTKYENINRTPYISCTLQWTGNTHTHPFNGPLSGTTRVIRYQKGKTNLDFTEARDSEWQWHQPGHMQVCTSLQTDNHASTPPLSFLQAVCPSCRPTNSQSTEEWAGKCPPNCPYS